MPLKPDDTILNGKYRVVRLIAKGGMARVWLAEELTFGGRLVALKEPRGDLLPDLAQEVRLRYQREVRVCAALEKAGVPNIVRAITAEPYDDTLLLVMQYMPGGDLAALMKEHPDGLPVEQAVKIALDLLAALEGVHAHEMEIVHRDVKPSNVLFDEQGHAHLADFGLAQLAGVSGRSQLAGGQHPGTPIYMAPEQARSLDVLLPAADLYSVGCVLFEMLTGTRYKRVRPGTLPSALRAEVPRWLDGVVAKAVAEDPWERWHDAGEMARPLREGLRREAEARRKAEAREQTRPTRRPAWFWPVVGAAGVLVIAVALWLLFGGGPEPAETPTPKPTQVAVVEPTITATPTHTPTHTSPPPTNTPRPTASRTPSSTPTATHSPTATPSPEPSPTPASRPTSTSVPSAQPGPVASLGQIAFMSDRDGNNEIYLMNLDGSEQRNLTKNPADDRHPCWSPSGDRIAFASDRDQEGRWSLYVMTANGDSAVRILEMGGNPRGCSWASDGNRVAYSYGLEIHVIHLDGAGDTNLVPQTDGSLGKPSWSPGSSNLAFEYWSNLLVRSEIWTVNSNGSGKTYLGVGQAPAWSPDGARIAFVYRPASGGNEIYTMDTGGSDWVNLTRNPATDGAGDGIICYGGPSCLDASLVGGPSWSRDGRRIAFSSDRDDNFEIYTMGSNGEDVIRLTNNTALDGQPAWRP